MVKEQLKVASVSNDHLLLRWQYSYPHNQDYGRKKATEGLDKRKYKNLHAELKPSAFEKSCLQCKILKRLQRKC